MFGLRDYENPEIGLYKYTITPSNIIQLINNHELQDIDLLSIDIDYNDYWVLKRIIESEVLSELKVIVLEYNSHLNPMDTLSVPYNNDVGWDGKSSYFGASLSAFVNLLSPNFKLVHCEQNGVNAFFIKSEMIEEEYKVEDVYRKPNFYNKRWKYPERECENIYMNTMTDIN